MSKTVPNEAVENKQILRTFGAPWKGQILLACRKCQKKLKHDGEAGGIAKLGKTLKKRAKREEIPRLHVVEVSCLKLCPKGAVTVCTQQQLSRNECSIVRSLADVDLLLASSARKPYQAIDGGKSSADRPS